MIMAIDYTFVGIALTFCFSAIFFLLGFYEPLESPRAVVFFLFSTITNILCAQLFLMASATYTSVIPMHYLFYMFGVMSFILTLMSGFSMFTYAWNQRRRKKYGMTEEEDF